MNELEQRLYDKFTKVDFWQVVAKDITYYARFKVGVQSFTFAARDSEEEANWMRKMFAKALAKVIEEE